MSTLTKHHHVDYIFIKGHDKYLSVASTGLTDVYTCQRFHIA